MTVDVTGWCLQGERNVFHAVVQDRSIVWWDGALMRDRARGSQCEPPGSRDRCQRDLPCIVWVCEGVSDVTVERENECRKSTGKSTRLGRDGYDYGSGDHMIGTI